MLRLKVSSSLHDSARKAHYIALDGLRGIAALAVLMLHQLSIVNLGSQIPAALAVDFFFMLSGFVLAYAYGARLDGQLSWRRYMTARIIRLYPMLLFGICLGGLFAVKQALAGFPVPHANWGTFVATIFLLPAGLLFGGPAFLFNGVIWSLFFEIAASAVYGTRIRSMQWRLLLPAVSVVLIAATVWAGGATELGRQGTLVFLAGFARIAVSFAIGASIYHLAVFQRFPSLPFIVPAVVLLTLLLVPVQMGWPYDLACIFLAFPLIICVGGQASLSPLTEGLCRALGRLSYPLYLVHVPFTFLIAHSVQTRVSDRPIVIVGVTVISSIFLSWVALVVYDEPVRRKLNRLFMSRQQVQPLSPVGNTAAL